ncbi:5-oxoprolinase subunit PxpA [Nocardioides ferulae]|uniref:5-oxoprolinase subunit PxpA n=1 Tax=Nocardioides ferulae TaxID=2340821 RepID=UPI000EB2EF11|nr:5-oxoprolinase subunit PxpA [Nocardioides ferulae]
MTTGSEPAPAERAVDLNADLGEEVTDDAALLAVVTSANVACGFHAGHPALMREVCAEAARRGVAIGAQVSYDDRENFGRIPREVPYGRLREQIAHQVGELADAAARSGVEVRYVKPHGALYHRVLDDEEQAAAVLDGSVLDGSGLPVMTMPGVLQEKAAAAGRRVLHEGFPDRGYGPDGRLLPRHRAGAVLTDVARIARRAVELAAQVHSVCVHGDTPGAVAHAQAVRRELERAGYLLRSC